MRTILKFTVPVEAGNAAIKSGKMAQITENTIKQLKPEAAYFYANKGRRSGFMVFDLKEPSDIPSIVEPLFLELNASVDLAPCMSADDLEKALAKVKV